VGKDWIACKSAPRDIQNGSSPKDLVKLRKCEEKEIDMPCDQERKALQAATQKYAAKKIEHERLTKDEQGVKDFKRLKSLQTEVNSLRAEMEAKQTKLNECLKTQR
jgi:hypothetical protein